MLADEKGHWKSLAGSYLYKVYIIHIYTIDLIIFNFKLMSFKLFFSYQEHILENQQAVTEFIIQAPSNLNLRKRLDTNMPTASNLSLSSLAGK